MPRKVKFILVLTLGCLFAFTACTKGAGSDSKGGEESGEVTKITAWIAVSPGAEMDYLDTFNDVFPQYEVEYTIYADDELKEQSIIAIQAGTAPTIIRPKVGSQLTDFIDAGALMGLNKFSEQYGWEEMSYDSVYEACSSDGELYTVPNSTGGRWGALYYNADIVEELGSEIEQEMTIDEFLALNDKVQAGGYQLLSFGNLDTWPGLILMGDYFMQVADPSLIDDLNSGAVKWNESPEVLTVFESLQKYGQSGAFITGFETSNHVSVNQSFAMGKTVFMYCGTWWPGSLTNRWDDINFDMHTISLPRVDADTVQKGQQFFANCAYGINTAATEKEAEAAAAWINFIYNIDGMKAKFADSPLHSISKTFNESLDELGLEMHPLFEEEAFTKYVDLPQMNYADWAFDTSVIEALKLRIVDLFAGTITPQEAADAIAEVAARNY